MKTLTGILILLLLVVGCESSGPTLEVREINNGWSIAKYPNGEIAMFDRDGRRVCRGTSDDWRVLIDQVTPLIHQRQ